MKIINNTNIDTLCLKRLFTKCINHNKKTEGKLRQKSYLKITVKNTKRSCSGSAYLNGNLITMHIATENYVRTYVKNNFSSFAKGSNLENYIKDRIPNPVKVAAVFIHELQHARGYGHQALGTYIDEADEKEAKEAIGDFEFTFKQPKQSKPREDLQLKIYNHVLKMVSGKETQLKRLQNQLKKWKQKKKYYEKTLIAAGKLK